MLGGKDGGVYGEDGARIKAELGAEAVIMLVHMGKKGSGIYVSGKIESMVIMPRVLRLLADDLENDLIELQKKIEEN